MDGSIPSVSPLVVAGGQVLLSVAVLATGTVGQIDVLRSTPPYTDDLIAAVRTWRFSPALDTKRKPMDTRVLVGEAITAPSLRVPTLGTPPKDITTSDTRVPFPAQTSEAPFHVNARSGGRVLVETRIDASGHVVAVTAVRSNPPFDTAALDTARSWTFRPAQDPMAPPSTYAYLLFVFRQPVVGGTPVSGSGVTAPLPPEPKKP
jgi:TonB family protein